jgi:hypothetical protein
LSDLTAPISTALVGLSGSLVGALAALAGIWITMRDERGRERDRRIWERERSRVELKLESYADLIRAADDFRKAASDLRSSDETDRAELGKRFEEQSHLLDRAASRVNFVGSASIQLPLHALAIFGFTTISNIVYGLEDATDPKWNDALGRYYGLYDDLMEAARDDVGLEPIPRPLHVAANN